MQRRDSHRRRPDDPACRERCDQQTCLRDADIQIVGDLGQQARDDEFGGAHEECPGGQHQDDEWWLVGSGVGDIRLHSGEEFLPASWRNSDSSFSQLPLYG
ncbi:hypothetical protein [Streptomyces phaeochromogenes]|uniref:hypothetical protein n=1 Tax=Streptomyces phaeochromogenes TaxID=1923 RepID=UPI00386C726D|nr:hypothetical protein OHB08_48990 [Streptomyces phaeochromogenes]